jgi:hypothetical protein
MMRSIIVGICGCLIPLVFGCSSKVEPLFNGNGTSESAAEEGATEPTGASGAGETAGTAVAAGETGGTAETRQLGTGDTTGSTTGASGTTGGAGAAGNGASSTYTVTGKIGAAELQPVVSGLVSGQAEAGEKLFYLFSAPITCSQISSIGWLKSIPKGTQVLEFALLSNLDKTGKFAIPPNEAAYAFGGYDAESTEKAASSGSITLTKNSAKGAVEGTVSATFASGSVSGNFHAEYCATGQDF